ncbi:MAG TPA: P1 family peptidase [Gemmatimonadales bacterium]|nr:P1 family peptidase [Gemmatimonadales bacterium]
MNTPHAFRPRPTVHRTLGILFLLLVSEILAAQSRPRARDLGIRIDGAPGRWNAITDVAGVEVGATTLIQGAGRLTVGRGPVRTGVTSILPRGRNGSDSVFAAWFTLNGNGEMTGTTWVRESGRLDTPILITNTHSVGVVRDATLAWMTRHRAGFLWALPVVAETWDGLLNDAEGFHVRPEHVRAALDGARPGPVPEGNVGGGTGMVCHGFKGGTGTASRVLQAAAGGYTVGVLVQCNYGQRRRLTVAGVPVGQEIPDRLACYAGREPPSRAWLSRLAPCGDSGQSVGTSQEVVPSEGMGSIIIVVATDAPLLPHQLERVAKRVSLGVGRMGGLGENSSGDIFIAFSTANASAAADTGVAAITMLPNDRINPIFEATVQATEEAILNALVAAQTMTGADDVRVYALPHERIRAVMRKYNRLAE